MLAAIRLARRTRRTRRADVEITFVSTSVSGNSLMHWPTNNESAAIR
jgi:hypothetical protein